MIEESLRQKVLDRFIPEPMSGCWLWLGTYTQDGYGSIKHKRKVLSAHRLSYEIHKGEVNTLCVLHKCDTRECINPDHLFVGTPTDNMRDRDSKNRQASGNRHGRYTHPEKTARGEGHTSSKLTENDVKEIRRSNETQNTLAKTYNVSEMTIWRVLANRSWRGVK